MGAAIVLKNFIRLKGGELFHAVPELIKESLRAICDCSEPKAKVNVLKSLVALAQHHPKLVCSEMLATSLPYQRYTWKNVSDSNLNFIFSIFSLSNVVDFWQFVSIDAQLSGIIIDHFLGILSSSCLYEVSNEGGNKSDRQNIAIHQPFAIFCALKEMFGSKEIQSVCQRESHSGNVRFSSFPISLIVGTETSFSGSFRNALDIGGNLHECCCTTRPDAIVITNKLKTSDIVVKI